MLTDRQQKFCAEISRLAGSSQITAAEKENLLRAKKWLDRGDDFKEVINPLCLGLQSLESERLQGKLTPEVKELLEGLTAAYGEPVEEQVKIVGPTAGLDRGISRSFIMGGIGAAIFIALLLSTIGLSSIISRLDKVGAIIFYLAGILLALAFILIPDKKKK